MEGLAEYSLCRRAALLAPRTASSVARQTLLANVHARQLRKHGLLR
jgi:hypothetical protein